MSTNVINIVERETSGPLPTSTYNILNDSKIVGYCQLRHKPGKAVSMPEGFESHIYYEINEDERGHGYAKDALKLLLQEAKRLGLSQVILTISDENLASIKTALANGAMLLERKTDTNNIIFGKYAIELK